jgi:hypothetical protein
MSITPTSIALLNFGNRDGVVAKFTAIADSDTWVTGMSEIEHVDITNSTSGSTVGYTVSGGTVTFAVAGGNLASATVMVLGFK